MAITPSSMLPLGTRLPAFALPDTLSGQVVRSESLLGSVSVVAFICNHCPFVTHLKSALAGFGEECRDNGVKMVAISCNDVTTHPSDAPDKMAEAARRYGYPFPYLFDESQAVARSFQAACTPEFYVFDVEGRLAYRGQFDDSRPGNSVPVTGVSLRSAVKALSEGKRPDPNQQPSVGCSIKWKAG